MNITLCSAFRNADAYLSRYFDQIGDLEEALVTRGDSLRLIWGEGDSTDGTLPWLLSSPYEAVIVDCTHGYEEWGSIEHPVRFQQLAIMGNKLLAHVPADTNVLLMVESDLLWKPETLIHLIDSTKKYPCVAPMTMLQRTGYGSDTFYDIFAYRKDGKRFKCSPPYFDGWPTEEITRVDSVGSCWALQGEFVDRVRFHESDVVVGLCRDIYSDGGSVWDLSTLSVIHN